MDQGLWFDFFNITHFSFSFIVSHRKKRWFDLYLLVASINKRIPMWSKVTASCHNLKMQKLSFLPLLVKLKCLKVPDPPHTKRPEGFPSPAEWSTSRKIKFQSEIASYNLQIIDIFFFLDLKAAPGNGVYPDQAAIRNRKTKIYGEKSSKGHLGNFKNIFPASC